jgi:hypothetical protein
MKDMFKAVFEEEIMMSGFKALLLDYLTAIVIVILFLSVSAFDDSYEDSKLSAQVLEEAIAQANEDRKEIDHVLVAHQDSAIKH